MGIYRLQTRNYRLKVYRRECVEQAENSSFVKRGQEVSIRRKIGFAFALGIVFSFFYTAGKPLDSYDSLNLTEGTFYIKWFVCAVFVSAILFFLWEAVDRIPYQLGKGRELSRFIVEKIRFPLPGWVCVFLLLGCWLPAWLSLFPGAFSYDALAEWEQVRDGMITAHHPVIHVLWLGGLVEGIHAFTGSYNAGIAVYTFLQMFILANILTCTLRFLDDFHIPGIFQWFALLFYGLSPVMQLFAICATKDVLFSGVLLLFLQQLIRICCTEDGNCRSRKKWILFGCTAFFSMILRNNGLYIVLGTLLVMVFAVKKCRCRIFLTILGVCGLYAVYTGPVYGMLHVARGGVEEMLSVPIQQMARVHQYDFDSLEEQDLEIVYKVIPKEYLEDYRATVSDFVKKGFQEEAFATCKMELLKIWIKWGMEHPLTYVNSFLVNTVDFWYPHAVIDGYRDVYGKSSFFDYKVDKPGKEVVILPGMHQYYEKIAWDRQTQTLPFVFLVLSPGWYLVMTMTVFGYLWRCRRYQFIVPGILFFISIVTVLLGPMALVRYVLILYFGFPVVVSIGILPGHFIQTDCRKD